MEHTFIYAPGLLFYLFSFFMGVCLFVSALDAIARKDVKVAYEGGKR